MLWISQVVSQAGNRMFQIAIMWWIISQSIINPNLGLGSAGANTACFMILAALPAILFMKKIGRIIDRHPSRSVLLTSDVSGAVVTIALYLLYKFDATWLSPIFIAGFLYSLFQGFIEPTLNKSVPELVDEADIENAVAFITSTQTIASFFGAVLGAVLIERLGLSGIIWLNGASYLVSAGCDSIIKFKECKPAADPTTTSTSASSEPSQADQHKNILNALPFPKWVVYGFAGVNFFGTPVLVVMPLYTKLVLNAGASTLAYLEAAVWLGLLTGTFSGKMFGWKSQPIKMVALCTLGQGVFLGLPGLGLVTIVYALCLFLAGFSIGVLNVRMVSFFQRTIANHLKGSFFAFLQASISFSVPIGYFLFGFLADHLPITTLSMIQGFGIIAVSVYYFTLASSSKNPQLVSQS